MLNKKKTLVFSQFPNFNFKSNLFFTFQFMRCFSQLMPINERAQTFWPPKDTSLRFNARFLITKLSEGPTDLYEREMHLRHCPKPHSKGSQL